MSVRSSHSLLDRYTELGGNFLDTAHVYGAWDKNGCNRGCGNSEVVIGQWLKQTGMRQKMFIGTKGGHPDFDSKMTGLTQPILLQQIQESLDRLQTSYIDLYWLHRDDRSIPVEEILGWLEEPIRKGQVLNLGCSHWRIDRLEKAMSLAPLSGQGRIISSQIAWSLAQPQHVQTTGDYGEQLAMDPDTWNFHRENNLPLVAYHTQASGFFSGKYDGLNFEAVDFPKPEIIKEYGTALNMERRKVACSLASKKGCSTNQIALAWLLQQPFPVYAIVGPGTIEQLEDSIHAGSLTLNEAECHALSAIR